MKKIVGITLASLCFAVFAFAQSAEYSKHLAKAKEYEKKKQWAFALDSYYDAIGCADETSLKTDALNGYEALSSAIKSGNPGLGSFNSFTIHDEWKNLLIDAEKLGNSICKYEVHLGKLERGDLNYETKTATYKTKGQFGREVSDRYKNTIGVIEVGYEAAYKSDWKDLPRYWPYYSVNSAKNEVYDVAGVKLFGVKIGGITRYFNAFAFFDSPIVGRNAPYEMPNETDRSLYDYEFNIVDENGKELVKGKRWLLHRLRYTNDYYEGEISFDGIIPDIMDLIDNGKAFINPVAVYLKYGKYNRDDDGWTKRTAGDEEARSFVKNLSEIQLDMSKAMIYCWNKTEDLKASRFAEAYSEDVEIPLVKSYFEKISAHMILDDRFALIKLDSSYDRDYDRFNLKDEAERTLEISSDAFLKVLEKITNQKYVIYCDFDCYLIREMTSEEISASKKSKRR